MSFQTTTDYSGRKVDLCLFPSLLNEGVPANMELGDLPKAIAGPSKAAQGFIQALLSVRGEFRGDPTMGTMFYPRLMSGEVRYPGDLERIFTVESIKAIDYWNLASINVRPLDEMISTVSLENYNLERTAIDITLSMLTRDEVITKFLLPVNWAK